MRYTIEEIIEVQDGEEVTKIKMNNNVYIERIKGIVTSSLETRTARQA